MSEQTLHRVHILFEQGKYAEAEKLLLQLLPSTPEDPLILHYLAEAKLQTRQLEAAESFSDTALSLDPNNPALFFLKARIYLQKDAYEHAEAHLIQAIHLDPEDPDYPALLASIKIDEKKYEQALELSNRALELDSEHILALNNRSRALLKLKRNEESFQTIENALQEEPDNAYTHANYGWILLEKGDHKKALEHFREALKNDPESEIAASGMAEALKAANPLYKLFLAYCFWIGNLTRKNQWAVIFGFFIAFRLLRSIAAENKNLQPFLYPLLILITVIAFSTWVISPISNLFLRLNPYGRYLLDKTEIQSSNYVGISLATGLCGLVCYFIFRNDAWLVIAALGVSMMVPLGSMLEPAKKNNLLVYYTCGMAVLGALAVYTGFQEKEVFNIYSVLYIVAFSAFQWIANYRQIEK